VPAIDGGRDGEDVKVASTEDEGVQGLCDEGDAWRGVLASLWACRVGARGQLTLCAAVGVDSPYEDEFGACVRDIAKDVEQVELHGGHSAGLAAWSRRPCVKRSCRGPQGRQGACSVQEGRRRSRPG
jgi:hypothetical protein